MLVVASREPSLRRRISMRGELNLYGVPIMKEIPSVAGKDHRKRLIRQGVVNIRGVRVVSDPWHSKGDKNPQIDVGVPVFPIVELAHARRA